MTFTSFSFIMIRCSCSFRYVSWVSYIYVTLCLSCQFLLHRNLLFLFLSFYFSRLFSGNPSNINSGQDNSKRLSRKTSSKSPSYKLQAWPLHYMRTGRVRPGSVCWRQTGAIFLLGSSGLGGPYIRWWVNYRPLPRKFAHCSLARYWCFPGRKKLLSCQLGIHGMWTSIRDLGRSETLLISVFGDHMFFVSRMSHGV